MEIVHDHTLWSQAAVAQGPSKADGQVGVHEIMLTIADEINAFYEQSAGSADSCALGLEDGDEHALETWSGRAQFVDDLAGLPPPPDLCKVLEYFRTRQVVHIRLSMKLADTWAGHPSL